MSPIRRKGGRIERPEKSIGTAGALRSDAPGVERASEPAREPGLKPEGEPARKLERESGRGGEDASSKGGRLRGLAVGLGVLAALLAAGLVAFAVFHWACGDDARDIQGAWYVNGSSAVVVIDEGEIMLTDEVAYGYEIDSFAKTVSLSFGDLSGGGRYRFSLDRGELAIIDGSCTWVDSFLSDLTWTLGALFSAIRGDEALPAEGDQVTLLSRELPDSEPVSDDDPAADGSAAGPAAGSDDDVSDAGSDDAADNSDDASAEKGGSEADADVSSSTDFATSPTDSAAEGNGE